MMGGNIWRAERTSIKEQQEKEYGLGRSQRHGNRWTPGLRSTLRRGGSSRRRCWEGGVWGARGRKSLAMPHAADIETAQSAAGSALRAPTAPAEVCLWRLHEVRRVPRCTLACAICRCSFNAGVQPAYSAFRSTAFGFGALLVGKLGAVTLPAVGTTLGRRHRRQVTRQPAVCFTRPPRSSFP